MDAPATTASPVKTCSEHPYREFAEALATYQQALHQAWVGHQEGFHKGVQDADLEYMRALEKARLDEHPQERFLEAFGAYQKTLREVHAHADPRNGFAAAWGEYVRAVQQAMARLAPQTLDANSLAMIGQSLVAAARYASWTVG